MKLRSQISLLLLLTTVSTVLVSALLFYAIASRAITDLVTKHLETSAYNIEVRIEEIKERLDDRLALISSRTQLRISLDKYLKTKNETSLKRVNNILTDALTTINSFEAIHILDTAGAHVTSVGTEIESFKETLAKNRFSASENSKLVFQKTSDALIVAMQSELLLNNNTVGYLIIESNADDFESIVNHSFKLGSSEELLLAKRSSEGEVEFLIGPHPTPPSKIVVEDQRLPILQALNSLETTFTEIKDYKGVSVFAATRFIEKLNWGLVLKVNKSEVLYPLWHLAWLTVLIVIATSMVALILSLKFSDSLTRPLTNLTSQVREIRSEMFPLNEKEPMGNEIFELGENVSKLSGELKKSRLELDEQIEELRLTEEHKLRLASIVENSRDAIMSVGTTGYILSWNKGAEHMFGYNEDEIVGRHVSILIPQDRIGEFEDHYARVKKKQIVRNIETERMHKDGEILDVSLTFSPFKNEKDKIVGVSAIVRNISIRKQSERKLFESLKEKELLLKEIHHRVKNNMQIISSLLRLQRYHFQDERVQQIFKETEQRVFSMGLVHERLYKSEDLAGIDFKSYLESLARELLSTYSLDNQNIKLELAVEKIDLGIDRAVPCGLLVNELISNALKHAFIDRTDGLLRIEASLRGEIVNLIISDDGPGLPKDFDFNNPSTLGLELIQTLSDQLDGTLTINSSNGTEIRFTFPIHDWQNQRREENGTSKHISL